MKKIIIRRLYQKGLLSEIDIHFAKFISGLSASKDPDIFLAAALVSRATGNGDICLDLTLMAEKVILEKEGDINPVVCPKLDVWLEKLAQSSAVGRPGDKCPLILDTQKRLYLYRYRDYEAKLVDFIKERVQENIPPLDFQRLKEGLDRLFPENDDQNINWQKIAAAVASLKKFCVINGGPGTGKTYTITKVLAILLEQDLEHKFQIYLAAPTGKAAARLKESIKQAKEHIKCSDRIKEKIPSEVYTIHRMLKPIKDSPYFRYNRENPLNADIVVVDEASMVDLALMAKLVQAIPLNARLILIGDKDQLASVEAGSVLGDICDRDIIHGFSGQFIKQIKELTGLKIDPAGKRSTDRSNLQDSIVVLQKSYRFAAHSGIGGLSRAVNVGDANMALTMLNNADEKSINWHELKPVKDIYETLAKQIVLGYQNYLKIKEPSIALEKLNRFKILCALNIGPFGVCAINRLAEQVLGQQNLIQPDPMAEDPWYPGRPVLITRNDYDLGLFNGDIGIALAEPESGSNELYVFFPGNSGEVRRLQPYRLPEHETVYAMTVHKSQGSEFDEVLFIMPEKDFAGLTRELVYTALTRARQKISIWGTQPVLRAAISRKIERTSGLRDALWH